MIIYGIILRVMEATHMALNTTDTTLLVTATVFDDRTILAYSLHFQDDSFSRIHECPASADGWDFLTRHVCHSYGVTRIRVAAIDRRPGTRATSRCCGHSMTASTR